MSQGIRRVDALARVAGHDLHTVTWSPDASPNPHAHPPVLLVPGLGGSTVDWQLTGERLAGSLHTEVTALDLPGFGRSRLAERPAGVELFVEVIDEVLVDRGSHVLIGNSMGGLVAVLAAAQRSDAVAGLVLADPALPSGERSLRATLASLPFLISMAPVVGPRLLTARKKRLGVERHVEARLTANCHDVECIDLAVREAMVALSHERLSFPEADRAYSTSARSIARTWTRALAAVERLDVPALVVHGRQDTIVPVKVAERLARLRPDWVVELLEACGHLPHLEAPDRFADLVTRWSREAVASA